MAKFVAYTDGYFEMRDQVGASAVVILDEKKERVLFERAAARRVEFDPAKKQRNNEQELGAIIRCVMCLPYASDVLIYSDSQYAVKVLSGEWEASSNLGLIDRFKEEVRKNRTRFRLFWVRGHSNDVWNERADKLCEIAADSLRAGKSAIIQSPKNLCFE